MSPYILRIDSTTTHNIPQKRKECKEKMRISKNKLGLAMLNAGVESIRDLAAASGVSINTISRSNNGGTVKLTTLRRIAAALNVDPAELLEEA